jgi:type II secretory pathway pseudopilin PulG
MPVHRAGFTLLEICLALAIAMMMILLVVPSVSGLLAEQRLKQSFERFDQLVATTMNRSISEQRAYALVWERGGIRAVPLERKGESDDLSSNLVLTDGEAYELQLPAALARRSTVEWVFWNNGTCEPAVITFQGTAGSWVARYDPLTAHGQFLSSTTR